MSWLCCGGCCTEDAEDIRELIYNHNSLKEVPSSVFAYERTLEELHLEANRIVDLPRALFHCHGLKVLNLSDNDIKTMPPAIASLINLQQLNLSKNSLTDIPDNIKCCKQLIYVNASVNPLEKLPEGFTQLIALEELYLSDTFLEFLPANFGRLSKLRILDLRENHLNTLPKSIARLASLQVLDIGRNEFSDLPEVLGQLPELRDLWADYNKIRTLPAFMGNLPKMVNLDVANNNIHWIAPDIERCTNMSYLILSGNELTSLPEEIGNLQALVMLKIDDNDIESLPRSIGKLSNLEELVISQNVIESIPASIGLLRKVQTINADDNRLSELPSELCSCASLRILSVRNNELSVMPAEIGHLTGIRVINIADNLLRNLPVSILNLTNLNALWLSTNQSTPLTTLQQEIDPKTGLMVCVNFMFPQYEQERQVNVSELPDKEPISVERPPRPHIRFADSTDLRNPSRLTRAPTPYPKELRSMAKHARILTTKPMPNHPDSDEDAPLLEARRSKDIPDRNSGVKTAMVKKPETSMTKAPVTDQTHSEGYSPYNNIDAGIPLLREEKTEPDLPLPSADGQHLGPSEINKSGAGESNYNPIDNLTGNTANIILATRSDVGPPMPHESGASRGEDRFAGHEKDLPGVSAVLSLPETIAGHYRQPDYLPPRARAIENFGSFENLPPNANDLTEDIHMNVDPNSSNGMDSSSPPATVKVPPPYHIAAVHSKQAVYFMNAANGESISESPGVDMTDSPMPKTATVSAMTLEVAPSLNPVAAAQLEDAGRTVSDASPTAGQAPSANETLDELRLDLAGVTNPDLDKSPRSPSVRCNIPVLKAKEPATTGIPKLQSIVDDVSPADKNSPKQLPPRPRESLSKIPSFSAKEPKLPVVKKPSGIASGNSSTKLLQPGFHSSSQLPVPKTPAASSFPEGEQSDHSSPSELPTNGNEYDSNDANCSNVANGNGVDAIPSETTGFKSRIPARVSPVKSGSSTPNSPTSPTWVFGQHKNPTVFPLTLVKNPGLGFSISGGTATEMQGIFITKVLPGGPACGALMVGDKILAVDGTDFSKLEHDQAVGILKQTKNVVQLMVSRQK